MVPVVNDPVVRIDTAPLPAASKSPVVLMVNPLELNDEAEVPSVVEAPSAAAP
jgi:hypothetical protein